MSHDAHSGTANDAAEVVEPEPIPLAPPRNYLWPLGLSLIVAALLIYFLLFYPDGGNLSDPPAPPGPQTGITTVTVTATAEPSAVALSNPSPTLPPLIAPNTSPIAATITILPTASPTVAITTSATVSATTAAPTPVPVATMAVAAPRTLQLGNVSFAVEVAIQASPSWQFNPDPSKASWLPTTALPYVIGIPYSAANAALFTAAKLGQTVTMQNSVGTTLRFQVKTVARVKPEDISSASHLGLGLTLYLLADPAPDRAMISATLLDVTGGSAAP